MRALFTLLFGAVLVVGVVGLLRAVREGGEAPRGETQTRMPAASAEPVPGPVTEDAPAAAEAPRHAPEAERSELRAWNAEGIAALEAGKLARATELFERCRAERPDEPVYAFNLGETLARLAAERYAAGEQAEAVELLTRAAALVPGRVDLAARLERWRTLLESDAELWQYESDHFELAFDAERSDLLHGAQDVLDVLELAYHELSLQFALDPIAAGRPRVRVVVTEREEFGRATGLGEWAGGAYDGVVRVPLADLSAERSRLQRVLRHELAHVFVHVFVHEAGGKSVPGWLNEGLCQWLEGERDEVLRQARELLAGRVPFALDELRGGLTRIEPERVAEAYALAVVFVDGIARTYGGGVPFELVRGCARGRAPETTFERETGVPLATAWSDLAR